MKRLIPLLLAVPLAAAACTPALTSGTVIAKQDVAAHSETVMMPAYRTQCVPEEVSTGTNTYTTETVCSQVIAYWYPVANWVPEAWSIKLRSGQRTGWLGVTQAQYGRARVGKHWGPRS